MWIRLTSHSHVPSHTAAATAKPQQPVARSFKLVTAAPRPISIHGQRTDISAILALAQSRSSRIQPHLLNSTYL
jgi:hypothetical protein